MLKNTIRFVLSRIAEVITVGFPFCGFKILSGIAVLSHPAAIIQGLGLVVLGLGVFDLVINLVNFVGLMLWRRRLLETCTFSLLLKKFFNNSDMGNSLDVLLSFVLVALMIAFGKLSELNPQQLFIWNLCVIFNVLGAGLNRFGQSIKSHLGT